MRQTNGYGAAGFLNLKTTKKTIELTECVNDDKACTRWYNETAFDATAAAAAALLQITISRMTSHRATLMHRRTIRWEFNSRLLNLMRKDHRRRPATEQRRWTVVLAIVFTVYATPKMSMMMMMITFTVCTEKNRNIV